MKIYSSIVSFGSSSLMYSGRTEEEMYKKIIEDMRKELEGKGESPSPMAPKSNFSAYAEHLANQNGADITFSGSAILDDTHIKPDEKTITISRRFYDELMWGLGYSQVAIFSSDPDRRAYGRDHANGFHKRLDKLLRSVPEGQHPDSSHYTKGEWTSIEAHAWMAVSNTFGLQVLASSVLQHGMKIKGDANYWYQLTFDTIPKASQEVYDYWVRLFQLQQVPMPKSSSAYVKTSSRWMPKNHYLGILDPVL